MFASSALVTPLVAPFHVRTELLDGAHAFHFLEGVPFIFHQAGSEVRL